MKKRNLITYAVFSTLLVLSPLVTHAQTAMMSAGWAEGMCEAWNAEPGLTANLDGWIENDKDRGYKLMRIYRRDCPESPRIEMKVAKTDAGVVCVESGWATDEELTGADYVMFADTNRWQEMGAGLFGPMKGMMTGRLKFQGPKFEAMRNMGPFSNFLLLVGKVPGSTDTCPEMTEEEPVMEEEAMAEEDLPGDQGEPDGEEAGDGKAEDGGQRNGR